MARKPFEISGWWWMPSDLGSKIPGKATFREYDETKLEALNMFPHEAGDLLEHVPVIHGQSEDHKYVTLLRSYEKTNRGVHSTPPTPFFSSEFRSDIAIIGAHLSGPEPQFTSVTVGFTNLNLWCNIDRGVDTKQTGNIYEVIARLGTGDESITSRINDRISVKLHLRNVPIMKFDSYSNGVNSTASFEIVIDPSGTLDEYESIVLHVRDMLTLFIHRPIFIKYMLGKPLPEHNIASLFEHDVRIIRSRGNEPNKKYVRHFPSRMLAPLSQIKDNLPEIIRNWILRAPDFDLSYHLYFAVAFEKSMYLENRFLGFVQMLEGYHRRIASDDKYMSKVEYRSAVSELIKSIPTDLPDDLIESVKNGIRSANDYSLKERLRQIIARRGDKVKNVFFGDIGQRESLVTKVVNTRNYYAHLFDPSSIKHGFDDFDDQIPAIERLQVLSEACLLEIAGIEAETIDKFLLHRRDNTVIRYKQPPETKVEDTTPS